MSDAQTLIDWLRSYFGSEEHDSLVQRLRQRPSLTPYEEAAILYALVQHLRPHWTLEIGTFFAATTRVLAEAVVDAGVDGTVITIDPFGRDRVPEIVRSWPEPLRNVVDFRPWSSMEYFLALETQGVAKGAGSPLALVFIDGHHNFEYVLFDIIRSADHVAPGGAIVVDNLELDGPKAAAVEFLRWNPGWSLFWNGKIYTADAAGGGNSLATATIHKNPWGVLVPPAGVQVARRPTKLIRQPVPIGSLRGVAFKLLHVSHPGTLHLNLCYYLVPHDFHITGEGRFERRAQASAVVSGSSSTMTVDLPAPLTLGTTRPDASIWCEVELVFTSKESDRAYVVLESWDLVFAAPERSYGPSYSMD